jgi:heme/copper-type cytochrome/quinol oxidase subunit 2
MATNIVPAKKYEYKAINGTSRWVQVIFIISAILALIAVISGFLQAQLLNAAINGEVITQEEAIANDAREGFIAIIQLLALVIGVVVFLVWIHRASKNLHSFGKPKLNYSPGWAVGWFFIPIMSLFKPYQAVAEIAKASKPDIDPNLLIVDDLKTSAIIKWWWAFFLISNFLGNIAFRLLLQADALTSTYAYMASDGVDIIGFIVTTIMVKQISQSQELKFQKLNQSSIINAG